MGPADTVLISATSCGPGTAGAVCSASSLSQESFCSSLSAVQFDLDQTVGLQLHRATATGVGVKAVDSWLMLWSLISVPLFSCCAVDGSAEESVCCIQEWLIMSSKDGRSAGLRDRHHLMSC